MRYLLTLCLILSACITIDYPLPGEPTPVPTGRPEPNEPGPPPVQVTYHDDGTASVRFDLTGFRIPPRNTDGTQDDYFAGVTLACEAPPARGSVECTAVEISIRGTDAALCTAKPCGDRTRIIVRASPIIAEDNRRYREKPHRPPSDYLGEGLGYSQGLPIGPSPVFDVTVAWRKGQSIETCSPVECWTTTRNAHLMTGLGWIGKDAGTPGGIGWSYGRHILSRVGGSATVIGWTADDGLEGRVSAVGGLPY